MEIILLEKIRNLGDVGQVVNVKDGYGRNFLFKIWKKHLELTKKLGICPKKKNRDKQKNP